MSKQVSTITIPDEIVKFMEKEDKPRASIGYKTYPEKE
jgi:hypothetical protein